MHNASEIRKNKIFYLNTLLGRVIVIEKKLMAAYLEIINGYWEASV